MISYQEEKITSILDEIEPLLKDHYAEISVIKDVPFDPDYARYARLERTNGYTFMTCRKDAKLIGFIGYFTYTHIKHQGYLVAAEDVYYIQPQHRLGRTGIDLLVKMEKLLESKGVRRAFITTKVYQDHSKILDYLGYTHHQKNFTKLLDINK